tara:strand:- start:156 stop:1373 length:1218 start_codon:yes stop_codon:yes gene_type:complete
MILINFDYCRNRPETFHRTILEVLDKDDNFLLTDMMEGSQLWPLDYIKFDAHKIFYTVMRAGFALDKNFTLLCSDSNIKSRISSWKRQIDFEPPNIDVLNFPLPCMVLLPLCGKRACQSSLFTNVLNYMDDLNGIEKTKNFIQLTSSPIDFRILSLDRYWKHEFFEYSYVPWFHWEHDAPEVLHNHTIKDWDKRIENGFNYKKDFRFLNEIYDKLIEEFDVGTEELMEYEGKLFNKTIFNHFYPVQAFPVCCDIILESYIATPGPTFMTEKTWKPIVYKRPFLLLGVPEINQTLKDLNFELYDEIFDYSFDNEPDDLKRLHMFWEQIDRYINLDPKIFNDKLKVLDEKLEHNRKTYCEWHESNLNLTNETCDILQGGIMDNMEYYFEIEEHTFVDIKKYCGIFPS